MSVFKCEVDLGLLLGTRSFNEQKAATMAGWYKELDGSARLPETEEYGIASFVYRARRPFDQARLESSLQGSFPGLLRSKGYAWLAGRREVVMWSSEGSRFHLSNGGIWWADQSSDRWPPANSSHRRWIEDRWDHTYGDRRQEIVFIGQDLPKAQIMALLDDCLLTSAELIALGESYANTIDLVAS